MAEPKKSLMIDLGSAAPDKDADLGEDDAGMEDQSLALKDAGGEVMAALNASDGERFTMALRDFIDIHMG